MSIRLNRYKQNIWQHAKPLQFKFSQNQNCESMQFYLTAFRWNKKDIVANNVFASLRLLNTLCIPISFDLDPIMQILTMQLNTFMHQ